MGEALGGGSGMREAGAEMQAKDLCYVYKKVQQWNSWQWPTYLVSVNQWPTDFTHKENMDAVE